MTEVVLSLSTSRLRLARRRADQVDQHLDFTFAQAMEAERGGQGRVVDESRKWLESLVVRWASNELDEWETDRALRGRIRADDLESEDEGFDTIWIDLHEALEAGTVSGSVAHATDMILADVGRTLDDEERAFLNRLVTRALIEVIARQRARARADYRDAPLLPLGRTSEPATAPPPNEADPTVAEAVERYVADHDGVSWTPRTARMAKTAFRWFVEFVGPSRRVRSIGREDIRRYRDVLQRLPAGIGSRIEYRGKALDEVLASNPVPGLGIATINTHIRGYISGFFSWCVEHEYVIKNPAKGMAFKTSRNEREERLPLTSDELRRVFGTGYAAVSTTKGNWRPRSAADYWLPLLMLYTGARNEEVAQLHVVDVEQIDDVCVRVQDLGEDQKVKTASARRVVPIHSALIDLGFLEYHASTRE